MVGRRWVGGLVIASLLLVVGTPLACGGTSGVAAGTPGSDGGLGLDGRSDSSRTAGPRRTMSFSSSIASACQMPCLRAPQRNRRRCREEEGAGNDSPRPLGRTLPVATPRRAPQMAFVPVGVLKDPGF